MNNGFTDNKHLNHYKKVGVNRFLEGIAGVSLVQWQNNGDKALKMSGKGAPFKL